MFDGFITTIIILSVIYIAIIRAVFSIGKIVENLEEQTIEAKKQTAYQKAIYKKIKILLASQGINEDEITKEIINQKNEGEK